MSRLPAMRSARAIAQTNGLGNSWSQTFDSAGRSVLSTDPPAYLSTRTFSALNQPLTVEDIRGFIITSNLYDPTGNRIQ